MQSFAFDHLSTVQQEICAPFSGLAQHIVNSLPHSPERTTALRKLLEAKDSAVRLAPYLDPPAQ